VARGKGESGAALVEFAMVVGLFVFILYGLVSFGMVLATKQKATNAVADAARAAVGAADDTAAINAATVRVASILKPGSYTLTPAPSVAACGTNRCITVTIVYNMPESPGLGLVVPATSTASAKVQYA